MCIKAYNFHTVVFLLYYFFSRNSFILQSGTFVTLLDFHKNRNKIGKNALTKLKFMHEAIHGAVYQRCEFHPILLKLKLKI